MNKEAVCALIDETYALAHVLDLLFEQVENAEIKINPHAVASIANVIAVNIKMISQYFHEDHPP